MGSSGGSSGGGGGGSAVDPQAGRLGLKALTLQPENGVTTLGLSSGVHLCELAYAGASFPLANLWVMLNGAGSGATGVCGMAAYTSAGVLIDQTADMSATMTSTGWVSGACSGGATIPVGAFYITILTHYTGAPTAVGVSATANMFPINSLRASVYNTGVASFPASFNPAAYTLNNGGYCMGAS